MIVSFVYHKQKKERKRNPNLNTVIISVTQETLSIINLLAKVYFNYVNCIQHRCQFSSVKK